MFDSHLDVRAVSDRERFRDVRFPALRRRHGRSWKSVGVRQVRRRHRGRFLVRRSVEPFDVVHVDTHSGCERKFLLRHHSGVRVHADALVDASGAKRRAVSPRREEARLATH